LWDIGGSGRLSANAGATWEEPPQDAPAVLLLELAVRLTALLALLGMMLLAVFLAVFLAAFLAVFLAVFLVALLLMMVDRAILRSREGDRRDLAAKRPEVPEAERSNPGATIDLNSIAPCAPMFLPKPDLDPRGKRSAQAQWLGFG
jgi:hypothetical protein